MVAPHTNLGIGGTITDPAVAVIEGAIIKFEDETLSESLDNETSDANGEYAGDLANLASQWSDADVLIITSDAHGYRQTIVVSADIIVPSITINFDNMAQRIMMVM